MNRYSHGRLLALCVAFGVAACAEGKAQCDPGTAMVNGKDCVPIECSTEPLVPCEDPLNAHCNLETYLCEACIADTDCEGFSETPVCDESSGTCTECVPDDESACGMNSCDPETLSCTGTDRGSVGVCRPCIADSECGDEGEPSDDFRCIELFFEESSQGGRCLAERAGTVPECEFPYGPTITRESLSGPAEAEYCGIREDLTTCEAVLRGKDTVSCTPATVTTDCAPEGALCEEISGFSVCTYPCTGGTQCPESKSLCEGGFCTEPPPSG